MNFKEFLQEYALPEKGQKSVYISPKARKSIIGVFDEDALESLYNNLKYVDSSEESGNYLINIQKRHSFLGLPTSSFGGKRSFQVEITPDEVRILKMISSRDYPLLKVDEPVPLMHKLLGA